MPQQVSRLAIVFTVLVGGLVLSRFFLVPATFGELGHYRSAAIDSVVAQPVRYAGHQVCVECHEDITEMKEVSLHSNVACEVCHGAAAAHVEDFEKYLPPAPRERGYCPLCHGYNPSRPTGFPQIDPIAHNPVKPCIACHDPHQPVTPHVPEACSACHGEIARTKAISHHAALPCVQCHETEEEHKVSPRLVRPGKPRTRAVCGGCHAKDSDAPREIPRVDLGTHGDTTVCWQCHYPHHPEVED
jgi:hypothetical protein